MTMLRMALAGAMILAAGSVMASEHLVGTWTTEHSETRGARAGESEHELGTGDALLTGSDEVWTLTIDEMDGQGFHAEWCSTNVCEDAVGVLRSDGETVYLADEDGIFIGTLGADTLELCYLEPGTEFRVADCHTLSKE
ncbi:MAG: hypothetical protein GVY13_10045 [Alphaproteobacteria bacterium]|jgi:hypothetical protein|nr:hypothetical protein [Alphaproteobacteria bacterium]